MGSKSGEPSVMNEQGTATSEPDAREEEAAAHVPKVPPDGADLEESKVKASESKTSQDVATTMQNAGPENSEEDSTPAWLPRDSTLNEVANMETEELSAGVQIGISPDEAAPMQDPVPPETHSAEVENSGKGLRDDSTLVEGSGAEQGDKKMSAADAVVEGEEAQKEIRVELDGEETRVYSVEQFGKILQKSQWSLTHRIEVCKVLQDSSQRWIMTPLSKHEYAKQSLALINSATKLSDVSESFPPFQEFWSEIERIKTQPYKWFSSFLSMTRESRKLIELNKKVESKVYEDWDGLKTQLEGELERVREKDKQQEWYTAFRGKDWQPWDIYMAVEEGREEEYKRMMKEIGEEHWGTIQAGEYRGATPLHWAALHNHVDDSLWKLIRSNLFPRECFDDFGFKPVHMAVFASSWLPISPDRMERDYFNAFGGRSEYISRCLKMIHVYCSKGKVYRQNFQICSFSRYSSGGYTGSTSCVTFDCNFFVFKLTRTSDLRSSTQHQTRKCFVAKLSSSTPIHPLHLAIWIGHPLLIEHLIFKYQGRESDLFVTTSHGDTILHLAALDMDDHLMCDSGARKRVMAILLRYLHRYPTMLNSRNKDEQTPLHIAVFQGSKHCVAALVRCPYINLNIRNKKRLTPLEIAKKLKASKVQSHRDHARILGRKCVIADQVGSSTVKYNDYAMRRVNNYKEIIQLIENLDQEILRHRQILQSSQWSLRHRLMVLQMFNEHAAELIKIKGIYIKQCFDHESAEGLKQCTKKGEKQSTKHYDGLKKLKVYLQAFESRRHSERVTWEYKFVKFLLERVYIAVEEGDLDEFKRSLNGIPVDKWSKGLKEYGGATPLHWAALYSRKDMVAFICMKIAPYKEKPSESMERKTWLAIVNAQDKFGFTPLHLVIFLSLMRLGGTKGKKSYISQEAKNSAQLIEELYDIGVPHCASNHSQSDFLVWNLSDYIYVDDYLSKTNLFPIHLGVCCAHPQIYEKLLESSPELALTININMSTGDTILHYAEGWEVLIKQYPKNAWGKIETQLLQYLNSSPKVVNIRNYNRETLLHSAVRTRSVKWVEVLLQCEHIKFNLRDRAKLTPGEHAAKMLEESKEASSKAQAKDPIQEIMDIYECFDPNSNSKDPIQGIVDLIDCFDPESWPRKRDRELKKEMEEEKKRKEKAREDKEKEKEAREKREKTMEEKRKQIEALQRNEKEKAEEKEKEAEEKRKLTEAQQKQRQVYVDAANAILVGAALIASASFGAWLQPPLGLHPYYSPEFLDTSAPPSLGPSYESFVPIQQYWTIQLFWIFNSLSFFFSLATVIAGADAALPHPALGVETALEIVKSEVKLAAWLLIAAILSVIATFATLGFTILPPITKFRINMICTLITGVVACFLVLKNLVNKLFSKDEEGPGQNKHGAKFGRDKEATSGLDAGVTTQEVVLASAQQIPAAQQAPAQESTDLDAPGATLA